MKEEERQRDKEEAILIALHKKMALLRDGLDVYGMKKDGSRILICKAKNYDTLWKEA